MELREEGGGQGPESPLLPGAACHLHPLEVPCSPFLFPVPSPSLLRAPWVALG